MDLLKPILNLFLKCLELILSHLRKFKEIPVFLMLRIILLGTERSTTSITAEVKHHLTYGYGMACALRGLDRNGIIFKITIGSQNPEKCRS